MPKLNFIIVTCALVFSACGNSNAQVSNADLIRYEMATSELEASKSNYDRNKSSLGALENCDGSGEEFKNCGYAYNSKILELSRDVLMKVLDRNIAYKEISDAVEATSSMANYRSLEFSMEVTKWSKQVELDKYVSECWLSKSEMCLRDGGYVKTIGNIKSEVLKAESDRLKFGIQYSELLMQEQVKELNQLISD